MSASPAQVRCLAHGRARDGAATAVLLHGLGSCADDWGLQLPALTPDRRVLTVDLPGHGPSPALPGWPGVADFARPVAAALDLEEPGPLHLVGLSLGGVVALQMALERPDRLRSLTLVNAFARLQPAPGGFGRSLVRLALLAFGPMRLLGAWVARGLFPRPDQAPLRRIAAQRLAANDRRAYLGALAAAARFDVRARLGEIGCPVLVVAGEGDRTVPLACKLELARGVPGARLEVLAGSGHATPLDAAPVFNELVSGFLQAADRAAAAGRAPTR